MGWKTEKADMAKDSMADAKVTLILFLKTHCLIFFKEIIIPRPETSNPFQYCQIEKYIHYNFSDE